VPLAGRRRPPPADSLVVEKGLRRLTLWAGGVPARTYDVALGLAPAGPKERAGDRRTPEGLYHIEARHPASRYHRALRLSYPNADDRARARALGVTPGGDVMIHGLPNGQGRVGAAHRARDWTFGCVALTDDAVDELWAAVPVGTPVRITP
jgi:murein L,D-transpeptidase YafK